MLCRDLCELCAKRRGPSHRPLLSMPPGLPGPCHSARPCGCRRRAVPLWPSCGRASSSTSTTCRRARRRSARPAAMRRPAAHRSRQGGPSGVPAPQQRPTSQAPGAWPPAGRSRSQGRLRAHVCSTRPLCAMGPGWIQRPPACQGARATTRRRRWPTRGWWIASRACRGRPRLRTSPPKPQATWHCARKTAPALRTQCPHHHHATPPCSPASPRYPPRRSCAAAATAARRPRSARGATSASNANARTYRCRHAWAFSTPHSRLRPRGRPRRSRRGAPLTETPGALAAGGAALAAAAAAAAAAAVRGCPATRQRAYAAGAQRVAEAASAASCRLRLRRGQRSST